MFFQTKRLQKLERRTLCGLKLSGKDPCRKGCGAPSNRVLESPQANAAPHAGCAGHRSRHSGRSYLMVLRVDAGLLALVLALCCSWLRTPIAQEVASESHPNTTTAADAVVVFNEVMFHPPGDDPDLEWIELHNQMSLNVDLSSWRVEGGIDFKFPTNTVINANGYIVIAANPARLNAAAGVTNIFGPFAKRLSDGGETLRLRNHNNRLMDELTYRDAEPWPIGADYPGSSLAKKDRFYASSPALNWRASVQLGGTPGTVNFVDSQAGARQIDPLIQQTSPSHWFVPSDASLESNWTAPGFEDSVWASGSSSLGYDVATPSNTSGTMTVDRAYSFEGTLVDSSGNNVHAESQRATFSTDVPPAIGNGKSLAFDGISAKAEILDEVNPAAYTISTWVLLDVVRPCSLIVRTSADGPRTSWSHQLRINAAGRFEHYVFDGGARTVAATNVITRGVWYHVLGTALNSGRMATESPAEEHLRSAPCGQEATGGSSARIPERRRIFFKAVSTKSASGKRCLTPA